MKTDGSYSFIKRRNESNKYDTTDVRITVERSADRNELLQAFKEFLLACGFSIAQDEELDIIKID